VVVKSSVNKSKIKIFIIQQIDRKVDLDEIAESKNLNFAELLTEIENICFSGTKLNLDYYIDEIMDENRQEVLYDYFLNSETDSLEEAINDPNNADFTEDDIRLMRVKFLSEYAN
jgi:ATP-dependent DNA helicase RecQ